MVSVSGYLIGSQQAGRMPLPPPAEHDWWYQFYFATERGKAGYEKYTRDFAKLIWKTASPKWNFDDATFDRSAAAFDNPDHVAVVIHNYRWRMGIAEGEAKFDDFEKRLADAPVITVPTITMEGDANGAPHSEPAAYARKFTGRYAHRLIKGGIGHTCRRKRRGCSPRRLSTWTASHRRERRAQRVARISRAWFVAICIALVRRPGYNDDINVVPSCPDRHRATARDSLWFSANSAADDLARVWQLSAADLGHLTIAVQGGFITGTLIFAFHGLADRFAASRIFAVCAVLGAAANAVMAQFADGIDEALMLRFVTGFALAGVFRSG